MQRYMVPQMLADFKNHPITITGDPVHHMKNVMRYKEGIKVYLSDPEGRSAVAEITMISDQTVQLQWVADEVRSSEMPIKIAIACGLPKSDKLDFIVQKTTELGVSHIIPLASKFSVVKWDESKMKKKQQRFQKIAHEAAEQSHRQIVPVVDQTMKLDQLIAHADSYTHRLIAYEEEAKIGEIGNFAQTLQKIQPHDSLLIVFGPEGGLAEEEVTKLKEHGFLACGLGPRIMRAETAPLYALSAISYHFELMNGGDYHRKSK